MMLMVAAAPVQDIQTKKLIISLFFNCPKNLRKVFVFISFFLVGFSLMHWSLFFLCIWASTLDYYDGFSVVYQVEYWLSATTFTCESDMLSLFLDCCFKYKHQRREWQQLIWILKMVSRLPTSGGFEPCSSSMQHNVMGYIYNLGQIWMHD